MPGESTAPDVEGITVKVDLAPNGTPSGSAVDVGHLEDIGALIDESRPVKKYTPLNNKQYNEIVSLGSISRGPFTMQVLYDPEETEGVNIIRDAIKTSEMVEISFEVNNALNETGTGTLYKGICKVSNFKVTPQKDGKLLADITAEKIGEPTEAAATAGA